MNKKLLLFFFGMILLIGIVSSQEIRFITPINQGINITEICYNNGTLCSASASCNITTFNPLRQPILNNTGMTDEGSYYRYELDKSFINKNGLFENYISCCDGNQCATSNFFFKVTPNGEASVGDIFLIILYIIFLIVSILLLYSFIINISKLATVSTTIYDVAFSWGVYFGFLIIYWLSVNYIPNNFVSDNMNIFISITTFTNGFLPILSLIITMIYKSTQKKKVLSVKEMNGQMGGWRY